MKYKVGDVFYAKWPKYGHVWKIEVIGKRGRSNATIVDPAKTDWKLGETIKNSNAKLFSIDEGWIHIPAKEFDVLDEVKDLLA